MAKVTVSNVIDYLKGYSQNRNLSDTTGIQQINIACDFVLNHLGVPGYEMYQTIVFDSEENIYTPASDMAEPLFLRYDDDYMNRRKRFSYKPGEFLFEKIDAHDAISRYYGVYDSSVGKQMIIIGQNKKPHVLIDNMDSNNSLTWTASNDATNITDGQPLDNDSIGAMNFDINTALSVSNRATLTRTVATNDISLYYYKGIFKVKWYAPNVTNFTSVSLNVGSSLTDYYKITVTTDYAGNAFVVGTNRLWFKLTDGVAVGTPNLSSILYYWFDFDYTGAFVSTTGFALDTFRLAYTDNLIFSYYTKYKGKDNSNALIETFSATTDYFLFGDYDTSFGSIVAMFAAINLNPQLLVDDTSVKALYKNFTNIISRKYPRKKVNNLLFEPKTSRTTFNNK